MLRAIESEYPAGTTIEIPEGMGTTHTYMGWRTITSRTSLQYQLREQSGEHYDSEGFGIIDGRYCDRLYNFIWTGWRLCKIFTGKMEMSCIV